LTTLSRVKTGLSNCLDLSVRLNAALEDGVTALVGCDYERLAQLAPEQEKLAFDLRRCELDLRGELAALSREVGVGGELRLQPLLSAAADHIGAARADEFSSLARQLRESTARTAELTTTNNALLNSLNTYINAVFRLLLGVEESSGYGGVPVGSAQRHLVDHRF
jgi:hypothetical protein